MEEKITLVDGMLNYKGKPLVRSGNTIYYGDMSEKYVAMLQILGTEAFEDMQLPNKVLVQIIATDPELRPRERILKKSEKGSLYSALNIADIWLTRALASK